MPTGAPNGINLSGGWEVGGDDAGWALSLQQNHNQLTIIAYIYDAQGRPRWLAGIADYAGESEVSVDMLQVNGYCETCEPEPVDIQAAGQITLSAIATNGPVDNMLLNMDVQFNGAAPIHWQRDAVQLQRVTPALPASDSIN